MNRPWPDWTWDVMGPVAAPAALQMALDEVLLGRVAAGSRPPVLRFWRWTERALVLGSHQSVANEIDAGAAESEGFVLARRMSGGGTMLCEPGGTITWSLTAPVELVAGMSFVESFARLDGFAVEALRGLGVDASYRPINDIVSPAGQIAGAAQARRRGAVLHHTTMAYSTDPALVPRVIRIGRPRVSDRGLRSAEKTVSPVSALAGVSLGDVEAALMRAFAGGRRTVTAAPTRDEMADAEALVASRYGLPGWIHRLP